METADRAALSALMSEAEKSGSAAFDLCNPIHRRLYYAQLGITSEIAQKRFPHLFRAVEAGNPTKAERTEDDYSDLYSLSASAGNSSNNINSLSRVETLKPKLTIAVNCEVYDNDKDPGHHSPVMSDGEFEKNTDKMTTCFESETIRVGRPVNFVSVATYSCVDLADSLEQPVIRSVKSSMVPNGKIVEQININDPARKCSPTQGQIIVCYNRTATPTEKTDYSYGSVIIDENGDLKDQHISIHMPFSGSIVINDAFKMVGVNRSSFELAMSIYGQSGSCTYNYSALNFDTVFKITDGQTLSWAFKKDGAYNYEDWQSKLLAKRVFNNTSARFYAKIEVIYADRSDPQERNLFTTVVVCSPDDYMEKMKNTKKIERILLWWGCLGKNSKIRLADGSEKPICEVARGDSVRLADGGVSAVECVLSGREETAICIETASRCLLASTRHPIMTGRGLVRAQDLCAADEIQTGSGAEPITGVYPKSYGELVYCLQLSTPGLHYANGVVVGDFAAQQSTLEYEERPRRWQPYESAPLADELADVMACRRGAAAGAQENIATAPYYACRFQDGSGSRAVLMMKGLYSAQSPSFTLEFWAYLSGEAQEVVSQKSGLTIGMDGDTIVIAAGPSTQLRCKANTSLLHRWTHFFFLYDGKVLQIGVNGLVLDSFEVEDTALIGDENLVMGNHFSGYLRRLSLYSSCLEEKLIRSRMFQNVASADMENLFAFVDASGPELLEQGPHQMEISRNLPCAQAILVSGYRPGTGRYCKLEYGGHINPGGFASGAFGVYLKFYLQFPRKTRSALFSNGMLGERDALVLYTDKLDNEHVSIGLQYGGADHLLCECVAVNAWQDIIISYQPSIQKLTAYHNGEIAADNIFVAPLNRKAPGEFRIGNALDAGANEEKQDFAAEALFTAVSVYDSPLTVEQAKQFYLCPPFLFEHHLIALFDFERGAPRELVSGESLPVAAEERELLEQTVFSPLCKQHCWYDVNIAIGPRQHDAELAYKLCEAYIIGLFGITVTTINEEYYDAVCHYLGQTLLQKAVIREILDGDTRDGALCRGIEEIHRVLPTLLRAAYANHPFNRRKSNLADKMGINQIQASVDAIIDSGSFAISEERQGALAVVLTIMRKVIEKSK